MHVLLIGSGGREHALAWKLVRSLELNKLSCAPGNAGIADVAHCVDIPVTDLDALVAFAKENAVDLVVVGPEAPLAAGLVDRLEAAGVPAFGPSAEAAQLEASKGYMKDLCAAVGAPTARYGRFTDETAAIAFLDEMDAPYVVKADGLAAGKGVVIAETRAEAESAIAEMFAGRFGAAGAEVVVEEFLTGEEASYFVISDGETVRPLIAAQDHKRAYDGDEGPNTGGMGAYSPAPAFDEEAERRTMAEIVEPTLAEMRARGAPFKGVLFVGLMLTADGPKLIEFNVRFGDPECQLIMRRMKSDLLPLLKACASGGLADLEIEWREEHAACVVLAAKGYPGAYEKGSAIHGLRAAEANPAVKVFHAGTKSGAKGDILANGGRVLNVTATAPDLRDAVARAYAAVDLIDWPEGFCRRDIGHRAL